EMYDRAASARDALASARALRSKLDALQSADASALSEKLKALAPDASPNEGRRGRRRGGEKNEPPTLVSVRNELMAAAMAMQGADIAPTAAEVAACTRARAEYDRIMARWSELHTKELTTLNAKRKAAGEATVPASP